LALSTTMSGQTDSQKTATLAALSAAEKAQVAGVPGCLDFIEFSLPTGRTITLSSALPDLTSSIFVTGPGSASLTVQRSSAAGTPTFRIFTIAANTRVRLAGMTVANGRVSVTSAT